jgi:hypothetical protein
MMDYDDRLLGSLLAGLDEDEQRSTLDQIGMASREQLRRKRNPARRARPANRAPLEQPNEQLLGVNAQAQPLGAADGGSLDTERGAA